MNAVDNLVKSVSLLQAIRHNSHGHHTYKKTKSIVASWIKAQYVTTQTPDAKLMWPMTWQMKCHPFCWCMGVQCSMCLCTCIAMCVSMVMTSWPQNKHASCYARVGMLLKIPRNSLERFSHMHGHAITSPLRSCQGREEEHLIISQLLHP